jgi:hypothetical protein
MKQVSLNFGAIKDTVYRLSAKELMSESKEIKENNSLKKFIKKIQEEPLLKVQYMIFENLTKGHFENERLAERYINENLSLAEKINWHKLLECNKKVRKEILDENFVQGTKEFEDLYEAIHTLIESRSKIGFTDINNSHKSFEKVLTHLQREINENARTEEEKNDMPNFLSWRYINEHAVSNFNKRYKHLNESDKKLFKILVSSDSIKINYAKDLKNESLEMIQNLLDDDADSGYLLENFKNKLNSIENIDKNNVDEIIINCHELNENLLKLQ